MSVSHTHTSSHLFHNANTPKEGEEPFAAQRAGKYVLSNGDTMAQTGTAITTCTPMGTASFASPLLPASSPLGPLLPLTPAGEQDGQRSYMAYGGEGEAELYGEPH